jgi:hypothetical protein
MKHKKQRVVSKRVLCRQPLKLNKLLVKMLHSISKTLDNVTKKQNKTKTTTTTKNVYNADLHTCNFL